MKRARLLSLLKLALALAVLALVLSQAELGKITAYAKGVSPLWLMLAFLLYTVAQWFAAQRMRYYYLRAGKDLTQPYCLRLTMVAMFYNLVVPGGIGGDGYKVFLLKQRCDYPVGEGIRLQISMRASGMMVLMLTMLAALAFADWGSYIAWRWPLLVLMLLVLCAGYFLSVRLLLNETPRTALGALPWSFGNNALSILAVMLVAQGLGAHWPLPELIATYCLGQVLSLLPLTIGGLGLRELTFYYVATIVNASTGAALDPEFGVTLSLLFFAVHAATSMLGIIWLPRIAAMTPNAITKGD